MKIQVVRVDGTVEVISLPSLDEARSIIDAVEKDREIL